MMTGRICFWTEQFQGTASAGRKRVQMLVAYGVKGDWRRELLAFLRTRGESQADWESLLQDLFRRGLESKHLQTIVTERLSRVGGCDPVERDLPELLSFFVVRRSLVEEVTNHQHHRALLR